MGGSLLFGTLTDNLINDASPFKFSGSNLQTQGKSEILGALTLTAISILDFGMGVSANTLAFADSSTRNWTGGAVLTVENWTSGTDTLKFGSAASALTETQLGRISFLNPSGFTLGSYGAAILSDGRWCRSRSRASSLRRWGWLAW